VRRYTSSLGTWVAAFGTMPNYVAVEDDRGAGVGPGNHRGIHALWPGRANFRSSFIFWGEGVKAERLGEISLVDVGPALAASLGLRLGDGKESALWLKLKK
jgi:hypothetical protein